MCGRFQIAWPWKELAGLYGLANVLVELDIIPRFNIGPTYEIPVVRLEDGARHGVAMRWGFPAMWLAGRGKDPFSRALINAKAEDAHTKGTWKKALAERRCVVPASGFYEWHRVGKARFPLLFERNDGLPMAFAGLWGSFRRGEEQVLRFTVLTAGPGAELSRWHDRGPCILEPEDWDAWLDPERTELDAVRSLLRDVPDGLLRHREVSTRLGSIKNTGPDLMEADWSLEALEG